MLTTVAGSYVTYRVVARLIPVPVIRHLIGIFVGLVSLGIWTALYSITVVFLIAGWSDSGCTAE
jgi:hypothetical protein